MLVVLNRSLVLPTQDKAPTVKLLGSVLEVATEPATVVLGYHPLIVATSNLLLYKLASNCSAPKSQTSFLVDVAAGETINVTEILPAA